MEQAGQGINYGSIPGHKPLPGSFLTNSILEAEMKPILEPSNGGSFGNVLNKMQQGFQNNLEQGFNPFADLKEEMKKELKEATTKKEKRKIREKYAKKGKLNSAQIAQHMKHNGPVSAIMMMATKKSPQLAKGLFAASGIWSFFDSIKAMKALKRDAQSQQNKFDPNTMAYNRSVHRFDNQYTVVDSW